MKTLKRLLKADALILGGLAIYSGIIQAGSNSNSFPPDPSSSGFVFDVTDGDTVKVSSNGEDFRVRLAQIDAPERNQPHGSQATQALEALVLMRQVELTVTDVDRYGRLVATIYIDGVDVNRALVAEGHAWVYRQYMTDETLLDDESKAREARMGLWADSNAVAPWDWRRGVRVSSAVASKARSNNNDNATCGSKRYCGEMSSCEEAMYFLNSCGLSRLDGDGDGILCESLCR